jgi:hypothetical protein
MKRQWTPALVTALGALVTLATVAGWVNLDLHWPDLSSLRASEELAANEAPEVDDAAQSSSLIRRTSPPGGVPANTGESIDLPAPPAGFRAAVCWMQAVQDTLGEGESRVETDWMRLYAVVDGRDVQIANDDFQAGQVCGGLYTRYPWFGGNVQTPMRSEFLGGHLLLRPSENADKVYHWWNCERASLPEGTTTVWAQARIRIHGPAAVQAGIDYWRDLDVQYGGYNVNNREAASSAWFYDDEPGWQIITVGKRRPAD